MYSLTFVSSHEKMNIKNREITGIIGTIFAFMLVRFSFDIKTKIMLNFLFLKPTYMKKLVSLFTLLIIIGFNLSAQRTKDVLYLKDGSIIYGKLIEIKDDNYRLQASDGSIFVYKTGEVEKFAKESPLYDGRKSGGFGFAIEGGLLVGAQNTDYNAPFSFNVLAGFVKNTKHLISFGSGVEFIGKPYTPLFIEYKYMISE